MVEDALGRMEERKEGRRGVGDWCEGREGGRRMEGREECRRWPM